VADGAPGTHPIVLVRHGATEWSANGRHTSHTDLPLTAAGVAQAEALRDKLRAWDFALVLTSPMQRARDTARLAGFPDPVVDDDLHELDYGDDEGRTTADIRTTRPGWTVWDGCEGGETLEAAGARADRLLGRADAATGPVLCFGHGHDLRIVTARWLGQPPDRGCLYVLETATVTVLDHEREQRVLRCLNA